MALPWGAPVMEDVTGWFIVLTAGALRLYCLWMINFLQCRLYRGLLSGVGFLQESAFRPSPLCSNGSRMAVGGRAPT